MKSLDEAGQVKDNLLVFVMDAVQFPGSRVQNGKARETAFELSQKPTVVSVTFPWLSRQGRWCGARAGSQPGQRRRQDDLGPSSLPAQSTPVTREPFFWFS